MNVLILLSTLAWADLAPEPGYVETCTAEIQCGDIVAHVCDASFEGRPECEKLEAAGHVAMCRTWGGSFWNEVFCETQPAATELAARIAVAEAAAAPGLLGRCGCTTTPGAAAVGGLLLLIPLFMRRRNAVALTAPGGSPADPGAE